MIAKWNRWKNGTSIVVDGKRVIIPQYNQWRGMVSRVLNNDQGYEGVSISENFINYDWWYDWALNQKGFLNKENNGKVWPIDKDVVGDSTIYSEDVCVFVPLVINNLFIDSKNKSNVGRIGVRKVERVSIPDKYEARLGRYCTHIGTFDTVDEAYRAYLSTRLAYSKELFNMYGSTVDDRVWDSLFKSCEYSDIPDILNI